MRCKILYRDISKILKLVLTSLINRTKIFSQTIMRKKKGNKIMFSMFTYFIKI